MLIETKMQADSDSESDDSQMETMEHEEQNDRLSDEDFPISDDEDQEDQGDEGLKGWAGTMAKVLNSDKTGVLSKAKKVEDIAKKKIKKSYDFEIDGAEKDEAEEDKPSEKALARALEKRKYRERRENKLRVFSLRLKPSIVDLDRERTFKKIATRGVVQLFNAVKKQQGEITRKLQSTKLESKRQEIITSKDTKKAFLDELMSGPRARSQLVDQGVKKEKKHESSSEDEGEAGQSTWSALRDDFMTGKKVGWDKEDSEDEEDDEEPETDSD